MADRQDWEKLVNGMHTLTLTANGCALQKRGGGRRAKLESMQAKGGGFFAIPSFVDMAQRVLGSLVQKDRRQLCNLFESISKVRWACIFIFHIHIHTRLTFGILPKTKFYIYT